MYEKVEEELAVFDIVLLYHDGCFSRKEIDHDARFYGFEVFVVGAPVEVNGKFAMCSWQHGQFTKSFRPAGCTLYAINSYLLVLCLCEYV